MSSNWAIPRQRVINTALVAIRRGYGDVSQIAEEMTRFHYRGLSPAHAEAILRRDLYQRFYEEHAGRTEAQERVARMARTLKEEGWTFVPNFDQPGGFWRHTGSGLEVNNGGGTFSSWAIATERTFNSASRDWLVTHWAPEWQPHHERNEQQGSGPGGEVYTAYGAANPGKGGVAPGTAAEELKVPEGETPSSPVVTQRIES
jgi:hypothetical protein